MSPKLMRLAVLLSLLLLFLAGCPKKQCPDITPDVVVLEPEHKVYPIEPLEPLETVTAYPLTEPGVIAGIKEEDIKAAQRNMVRVMRWGITNQSTLEEINKLGQKEDKEKGTGD